MRTPSAYPDRPDALRLAPFVLSRLDGKPECEAKTMIRLIGGTVLITAFTLMASGCAYVGPSAEGRAWERYKEHAPRFTDEEKSNMTVEEKLAIYNAHVHPDQRLSCSMGEITGSHQPAWRCFTADELHAQNEAARDFMLSARRGTTF